MARGLGDVLDVYLDPPGARSRAGRLLVPLEPGAWVAAAIVRRLVARLTEHGLPAGLAGSDAPAQALAGRIAHPRGGERTRLEVEIATAALSRLPERVLAIVTEQTPTPPGIAWLGAVRAAADLGVLVIGAPGASASPWLVAAPHGRWLASISERDALRTALGANPDSLGSAAVAIASWLAPSGGAAPSRAVLSPL